MFGKMLSTIFLHKVENVTGDDLLNEKLHNLYSCRRVRQIEMDNVGRA
jgi:hypothetical protein